jgi:hypothetical protein
MKHILNVICLLLVVWGSPSFIVQAKTKTLQDRLPKEALLSYVPLDSKKVMIIGLPTDKAKGVVDLVQAALATSARFKMIETGEKLGDVSRSNDAEIAARGLRYGSDSVLILRVFSDRNEAPTIIGTSYVAGGGLWGGFSLEPDAVLTEKSGQRSIGEGLSDETRYSITHHATDGKKPEYTQSERRYLQERLVLRGTREGDIKREQGSTVDYFLVYQGSGLNPMDPYDFHMVTENMSEARKFKAEHRNVTWTKNASFASWMAGGILAIGARGFAGNELDESACRQKLEPEACRSHVRSENDAIKKATQKNTLAGLALIGVGTAGYFYAAPREKELVKFKYMDKSKVEKQIAAYNQRLLEKFGLKMPPLEPKRALSFQDRLDDSPMPVAVKTQVFRLLPEGRNWLLEASFPL